MDADSCHASGAGSNTHPRVQKMGHNDIDDDASFAKCHPPRPVIHLPAEGSKYVGEGQGGKRIPTFDGSVDVGQ